MLGLGEGVAHRAGQQRGVRRAAGAGASRRRRGPSRSGSCVEQHLAEVDGLDAVDEHLVGLGEQRDPAVGEPLDEVDLPQRAAAVQRARHDPGDQLAQLVDACPAAAARSGVRGSRGRSAASSTQTGLARRPGTLHPLAVARHEGDPVLDQRDQPVVVEAGRVTGLEDLDRRVVHAAWSAVSWSRKARSRGRSRSLIAARHPRLAIPFGRHGILTEVSGRPRVHVRHDRGGPRPRTTPSPQQEVGPDAASARSPRPWSSAPSACAGCGDDESAARRRQGPAATKTIEITIAGDAVTPNGDRVDVDGRPADRAAWSPPTRPARSTCTPTPSRSSSTPPARPRWTHDRQARHRRRRVAHAREDDRPARGPVSLPGSRSRRWATCSPTGSAAPRTSRSRPSWPSRGGRRPDRHLHRPGRRLAHAPLRRRHDAGDRPRPGWPRLVDSTAFRSWLRGSSASRSSPTPRWSRSSARTC